MNNHTYNQEEIDTLNKSIQKIDEIVSTAQIPLQKIEKAITTLYSTINSVMQSDAMQNLINICAEISEKLCSIDFENITKNFSTAITTTQYILKVRKTKWPLFFMDDISLREKILQLDFTDENFNDILRQIVFSHFTDEVLQQIEHDWIECNVIKKERFSIFKEALLLHKQGYYYASTSMLMCQIYGVASDIVGETKKKGLSLDDNNKNFVSEYFKIKREDIDKEKGRIMQTVFMTENGHVLFEAMAEYLQQEILCSSESKTKWETQPLRNKICHGDQLNFGTKEHSLKAILTIDMLVQLAYEIGYLEPAHVKQTDNNGTE